MPTFRITAPDGRVFEVNAPEGATEKDALARVQQQYQTPTQRRGGSNVENVEKLPMGQDQVLAIAAGRTFDKLGAGVKELGLSASVAGREAMDMQSGDQLRKLAALDEVQKGNDAAYAPLREKHPFLTGVGETGFLAATPVGQATAMGRMGVPAVVAATNQLLSYGSPKERAGNAAKEGAVAAAGGVVGEGVRMAVAPAKSALSAAQQQALKNASENVGYTPRASELTGNETLRRIEDAVARQPGGAGPMRDLMDKNSRVIGRHAAKAIGEDADELTTDVFARASERRGDTYNDLRSRANMPVSQEIFDATKLAETLLGRGDKTGAKKEAFDMIQRLKDELYETKAFDGGTYQSWASDLGSKAQELGKTNRTAAAALREVEKAMDKVARGKDAPAWTKADREHAAQEMLMKPGVVNEQTGKVSQARVANEMERKFGKNWKTGQITGEMADIGALGRALPPMREGSPTAGREAFGGLPGWMMAAPNYAAAKALTSEFGRDYLSRGLLGHPGVSGAAGGLLGKGAIPLSIAEIEALLLGYQ